MTYEIASPETALSDKVKLLRFARNDRILSQTVILTCSIAFFFLSACTQMENAKDTVLVKDTVMSYNKMLVDAAKTGNVDALKGIATDALVTKLDHWIASWHDSNVYMDGKLKDVKFKNITISGQTAKALTEEDWIYEYKNLETRQSVLPASGIHYDMEYILLKKDNKWIINEIKVKTEKKKEEKGNK